MVFYAESYAQIGAAPNNHTLPDVKAIQKEIMTNGPVSTCFRFYENFHTFFKENPRGIYNQTTGKPVGGHCVKIVGWGHDKNSALDYWLVANSWTTNWGTHGFFRFKRGTNLCEMDGSCYAGCPPADLTMSSQIGGSSDAPGKRCALTATPDAGVTLTQSGPVGGEWVEHDVSDTDGLLTNNFVRDTLDEIASDSNGKIKAVASHLLGERGARYAWIAGPPAILKVRTQVTRGIHVHMDLAVDHATTLTVFALHDAVDMNVRILRAHVTSR